MNAQALADMTREEFAAHMAAQGEAQALEVAINVRRDMINYGLGR